MPRKDVRWTAIRVCWVTPELLQSGATSRSIHPQPSTSHPTCAPAALFEPAKVNVIPTTVTSRTYRELAINHLSLVTLNGTRECVLKSADNVSLSSGKGWVMGGRCVKAEGSLRRELVLVDDRLGKLGSRFGSCRGNLKNSFSRQQMMQMVHELRLIHQLSSSWLRQHTVVVMSANDRRLLCLSRVKIRRRSDLE